MLADEYDPNTPYRSNVWLLSLLITLCIGCDCFGQIRLSESKVQTWVGFESPVVVGSVVKAGPNSKPSLASTQSLILVEQGEFKYKFLEVEAERIPSLETAELIEVDGGYTFKEGTPAGTYRVIVRAFDPDRGMASRRITVTVGNAPSPTPTPTPDPTPTPTPTPTPDDIRNQYGLGKAAFANAPDAATSKAYAKIYRSAADSLYAQNGQPLRFVDSDDPRAQSDPNRNVIAWINQQLAGAKPAFKTAIAAAFKESQGKRAYKREDWYAAFMEVADALEKVK